MSDLYERCSMCNGTLVTVSPAMVDLDTYKGPLNAGSSCPCRLSKTPGFALTGLTSGQVEKLITERDKLSAFKKFVHDRLDLAGVPTHPDGRHSKEGCRIGDRLDVVLLAVEIGNAAAQRVRELETILEQTREALAITKQGRDVLVAELAEYQERERRELAAAMGFPKDYKITGNRGEQVKQVGNAVEVNQATALILAMLEEAA